MSVCIYGVFHPMDAREVEVDANRIEEGLDGPALGNAALNELIDRLAIVFECIVTL